MKLVRPNYPAAQPLYYKPINWAHPLAFGLLEYTLATPQGLVSAFGVPSVESGSTVTSTVIDSRGVGRNQSATSSTSLCTVSCRNSGSAINAYTLYARGYISGVADTPVSFQSCRHLYGIALNGIGGTNGVSIAQGVAGPTFIGFGNFGASRATTSITVTANKIYDVFLYRAPTGGIHTLEVVGVGTATSSADTNPYTPTSITAELGSNGASSSQGSQTLLVGGFWARQLSPAERAMLVASPWQLFETSRRIFFASSAVAGTSVALSGIEATGEQGSLSKQEVVAVAGIEATAAVGIPVAAHTQALAGLEAIAEQGSVSAQLAAALVAETGTTEQGTLTADGVRPLVGEVATTEQGTVSPQTDTGISVSITGLAATATGGILVPLITQFARPIADISTDTWAPSTGVDNFAVLDEIAPDDGDYMRLQNPAGQAFEVKMAPLTNPIIHTGHRVRYRLLSTGGASNFTITMLHGTTQIAQWTHNGVTTATTYDQTLSEAEAIEAHDGLTDLRLRFAATAA